MDRDLRALSVVVRKHSGGPNGRRIATSYVTIQQNGQVVARAALGGVYRPADAVKEYRRLPQRFQSVERKKIGA